MKNIYFSTEILNYFAKKTIKTTNVNTQHITMEEITAHNIQIVMEKAKEPRYLKMYHNKRRDIFSEEKPPSWMNGTKVVYIRSNDYCKYYLEHPLFDMGCANKEQLISRIYQIYSFYQNVHDRMTHLPGDLPLIYDREYNEEIATHSHVNYQYGYGYYIMDYDFDIIQERLSKIQTKYHLQSHYLNGGKIHNRRAYKWNIMRNLSSRKSKYIQMSIGDLYEFIRKKRSLKYYYRRNVFEDRIITEFCMGMIQPHYLFNWRDMVDFSRRKVYVFWFEFVMKRMDYQRVERICELYGSTLFEYLEIK